MDLTSINWARLRKAIIVSVAIQVLAELVRAYQESGLPD